MQSILPFNHHFPFLFFEKKKIRLFSRIQEPITEPPDSKKMYFKTLQLHPAKVNLTFTNNMNTQGNDAFQKNPVIIFLKTIGFAVANIDNAPLKLNALILQHPFMSRAALQDRIIKHYKRAVLGEFYKLIGSIDLLGNPVGLFNDVSQGVFDFFYEPANAITKSPQEFGRGLAKGTSSLFRNSLHGTANAAAKVSSSLSKGVTLLTLDEKYIKDHQLQSQRSKPNNLKEGLVDGGKAFGKGLVEGATGLFVSCYLNKESG